MFYKQNMKSSPASSSGSVQILNLWIMSSTISTTVTCQQDLLLDSLKKIEFVHLKEFWVNAF
jgi:hypothetical protein